MKRTALTTREDFESWLMAMDEFLGEFTEQQARTNQVQLDYSPESLRVVEQLILDKYPNTKAMLTSSEAVRVNGLACYIGETFRKALGGQWDVRLDDPKLAFFGVPILERRNPPSFVECPLSLATAAADRRTGEYLSTVLEYLMKGS
jgi:hypothetical protein